MTKYLNDIILNSFVKQEANLDDIATKKRWYARTRVIPFKTLNGLTAQVRFDFEKMSFTEISIVTENGLEYIKLD